MGRSGVVTAPAKCEENLRTPVEIKQEPDDHEEHYDEPHAKHQTDSSEDKPSSSSLSAVEAENSYEFLGNMKYEADESTNLTATGHLASKKLLGLLAKIKVSVLISKKRDVCPLCQQVYNTKPGTYYGDHRKREFIAHLAKAHDYSHLQGYCRKMQCKRCKAKRERWTFVVEDGINYKFSDVCSRCQEAPRTPRSDSGRSYRYQGDKRAGRGFNQTDDD
ncbi:hypothetical protein AAVH_19018 [Aphelenchoides avenae]|nr:hypothetical protein AAVH_19018 [Aphelenchus avenae]